MFEILGPGGSDHDPGSTAGHGPGAVTMTITAPHELNAEDKCCCTFTV